MRIFFLYLILIVTFTFSCNSSKSKNDSVCNKNKINFNLNHFDSRGLIGDEDEKKALDYEFCIPDTPEALNAVKNIDSSIKILQGKGRTKFKENQIVMTGNSYNKDIKTILCKLSQLDYIEEINQVYWE